MSFLLLHIELKKGCIMYIDQGMQIKKLAYPFKIVPVVPLIHCECSVLYASFVYQLSCDLEVTGTKTT